MSSSNQGASPAAKAAAMQAMMASESEPLPANTNPLAVWALILAVILPLVGIILGHIAKSEIRARGQQGKGLATAALVVGYSLIVLYLLVIVALIALGFVASMNSGT